MNSTYFHTIYIILLLLANIFLVNTADAQAVKILPLGNSITQSNDENLSYRYALWIKLKDEGINFDFIGSMTANFGGNPDWPSYNGEIFDQDHEGHWGWRVDQINSNIPAWLSIYTPDIVLLHLGTNDMAQNNTVTSTVNELKDLIGLLRDDNPNVKILLATLIPVDDLLWPWAYRIPLLNAQIPAIAADLSTPESQIVIVDQYADFDPVTDTFDGVHPNDLGEEKMAQKWIDGLVGSGINAVINVFLEGLYNPLTHQMDKTQTFTDSTFVDVFSGTIADIITVELNDATNYSIIIHTITNVELNQDGTASFYVPELYFGSYWITIKNKNHIETVSQNIIDFNTDVVEYSFTTAGSQAYGSNQAVLEPGVYGIYAGDVDQNGIVNVTDRSQVDADIYNLVSGYVPGDIDGNGIVNVTDRAKVEVNIYSLIEKQTPPD